MSVSGPVNRLQEALQLAWDDLVRQAEAAGYQGVPRTPPHDTFGELEKFGLGLALVGSSRGRLVGARLERLELA